MLELSNSTYGILHYFAAVLRLSVTYLLEGTNIHLEGEFLAITDWLSSLNFRAQQDDVFVRRQKGTGQWLLEFKEFKDWLAGARRTLGCFGIRMSFCLHGSVVSEFSD
jgi:hypothetical protein